ECDLYRPLRQLKQLRRLHYQLQLHDQQQPLIVRQQLQQQQKQHDDLQPLADLHQAAAQLAHVGSRKSSEELRQLSHLRRALQQQHQQQKQQQHQQQQHPQAADPSQQLLPPRRLVLLAGP
ncbi:unnamed protein product, partial [Polarella glacialis]